MMLGEVLRGVPGLCQIDHDELIVCISSISGLVPLI